MKRLIVYLVPLLLLVACGKPKQYDETGNIKPQVDEYDVSMSVKEIDPKIPYTGFGFKLIWGQPGNEKEILRVTGFKLDQKIRLAKGEVLKFYMLNNWMFSNNVNVSIKLDGMDVFNDPLVDVTKSEDGSLYLGEFRPK